jgi:hypothetical protein
MARIRAIDNSIKDMKGGKGMKRYTVDIRGLSPLLMHHDNISFSERIKAWTKDPANKGNSTKGDDRTPPWTWIGYLYHDTKVLGIPSDNLMTMLREGGAKITKKGNETYKKQTQSGIILDQQQFTLFIGEEPVSMSPIRDLIGDMDFTNHLAVAEDLGFELLIKRAKIGKAKHVRVRPLFREWRLEGSLTVLDEEMSGITKEILQMVFDQAGALCGLGDWRPSSPSSGTFGRFEAEIKGL